jgi:hypothetical protein
LHSAANWRRCSSLAAVDHPWPDEIGNARWAKTSTGASKVPLTKVVPTVVVEVSADAALQAGAWRHPLRYVRYRAELRPQRVPTLFGGARTMCALTSDARVVRQVMWVSPGPRLSQRAMPSRPKACQRNG